LQEQLPHCPKVAIRLITRATSARSDKEILALLLGASAGAKARDATKSTSASLTAGFQLPNYKAKDIQVFGSLAALAGFTCLAGIRKLQHSNQILATCTAQRWSEKEATARGVIEETPNLERKRLLQKLARAFEAMDNEPRS